MLSDANNAFACDLYRQLATENSGDNLFFSPYSMFNALAMCAEGARGKTAKEMGTVLRLPTELQQYNRENEGIQWDLEPLHSRFSELNTWMYNSDPGGEIEIRIANALSGEKTSPLREEFVDTLDRLYQTGGVFSVDFKKDAEGARRRINSWVEEQSNHRITEIILRCHVPH